MNNLWPDYIKDLKAFETPRSILESQSDFLSNLTLGMIYASVDEKTYNGAGSKFTFEFNIRGKYLENYKFTAFVIKHGIDIYPLTISYDEDIWSEVGASVLYNEEEIDTPEQFESKLVAIFNSNKIKNVLKSIKSLSE